MTVIHAQQHGERKTKAELDHTSEESAAYEYDDELFVLHVSAIGHECHTRARARTHTH